VFALALVFLVPIHLHFKRIYDPKMKRIPAVFESFAGDLTRAGWTSKGSSVLYLWDPLPEYPYNALFLTSLLRHDPGIRVGRARVNQGLLSPAVAATYAEVFDFRGGYLSRIGRQEIPTSLERLRAAHGYIDLDSGFYLDVESWPRWWTGRDFALTAGCAASQAQRRLTVTFFMPIGPFENGDRRTVSIAVAGVPWRDVTLLAQSGPSAVDIALPPGQATQLRFHVDRAIDPSRGAGGNRERAIMVSGLQVSCGGGPSRER
jgi:hypothetical protein